jgi:hypothetical protein
MKASKIISLCDYQIEIDGSLKKIFNVGSGSVPITAGKIYEFEVNLFADFTVLGGGDRFHFGFIGNENCDEVIYNYSCNTKLESDENNTAYGVKYFNHNSFEPKEFPYFNEAFPFFNIKGTFKAKDSVLITPALSFDANYAELPILVRKGSVLTMKEIKTSKNIV